MAEEPDYYAMLGVSKTATADEIKAAHKTLIMKNHPDRPAKSEAEKQAAARRYQEAVTAYDVLGDAQKRDAYDRFGQAGVEGFKKDGRTSYTSEPLREPTYEDVEDFFARRRKPPYDATPKPATTTPQPVVSDDADAEARRRARLARAQGVKVEDKPAEKVTDSFKDAAVKAQEAVSKVRESSDVMAMVPVDALKKLRENLAELVGEIDKAIRKQQTPRP